MIVDWDSFSVEDALETLRQAPCIAAAWIFVDGDMSYSRKLIWSPQTGFDNSWTIASSIWNTPSGWYGFAVDKQQSHGPYSDRYEASNAMDEALIRQGWKLEA